MRLNPRSPELQDSFRAGMIRVALGFFALAAVPIAVPVMGAVWAVLFGYLAAAVFFQFLIHRGIGGHWRVLFGGIIDIGFVTFLVHWLGSNSTNLIAAYMLSGIMNALVAPPWTARVLSGTSIAAYGGVVFAEAAGLLPYAPGAAEFRGFQPTYSTAFTAWTMLAALIVVSTMVSVRISKATHKREALLAAANERLQELSLKDPLTQLYNRRYFVRRADEELERVRRGQSMAVLMIDLDGFKHINDEQGHLRGDEMLRRTAHAIEECTRAVDVIGRFGGDEFVVILTDTEMEEAKLVSERLVEAIRRIGVEFDEKKPVTASVGIAVARPQDDVVVLLNTADESAYHAKQAGGDRCFAQDPSRNSAEFGSGPRIQTG